MDCWIWTANSMCQIWNLTSVAGLAVRSQGETDPAVNTTAQTSFLVFTLPFPLTGLRFVGTVLPLDFRLIQVSLAHFTKKQITFFVWKIRNCFTAAVSPSNFERGVLLIHSPCPYSSSSSSSWSLPILSSPKTVLFIWTTLPFPALSVDATDQLCQGLSFSVCALLPWWWSSRQKDLCVYWGGVSLGVHLVQWQLTPMFLRIAYVCWWRCGVSPQRGSTKECAKEQWDSSFPFLCIFSNALWLMFALVKVMEPCFLLHLDLICVEENVDTWTPASCF